MEWLRSHPYLDALITAGALIIIGVLVVRTQLAAPSTPGTDTTWGGGNGVFVNTVTDGHTELPSQPTGPQLKTEDFGYIPLRAQNDIGTGPTDDSANFDFASFVASLAQPVRTIVDQGDTGADAYAFIPSGLIATTTLARPRSARENALYAYGNDVGDLITSFENQHPNQPATLKNHMEQKDDPEAIAALKKLGNDLAHLGDSIDALGIVPKEAASANKSLADAYRSIGTKLAAVPDARENDALYDAVVTYNSAAEDFVKKYVSLALLFQSYGVTFSPGDGGSIFVFPSSGL